MKNFFLTLLLLCFVSLTFTSCQKVVLDDLETQEVPDGAVAVRFNVSSFEQIPFNVADHTRATDVKSVCSRINLAVYQNGVKTSQVNQVSTDAGYGNLQVSLVPGKYKIVILAHSGLKNPTMTDVAKIAFDGKVTDTFYYCEDITVDEAATFDVNMKRAVAMFKFVVLDNIPSAVNTMRFYYTGGSSSFDAVHGVGSVNSRQSENREVTAEMKGKPGEFAVYTFPRADSNVLKVTVTAMDAGLNTLKEMEFLNVPIQRNMITQYKGMFFGGDVGGEIGEAGSIGFNLFSDDEWSVLSEQSY